MVVESCEVEGSEAIVFLVIDTTRGRETGKKQAQSSNVTPGERGERREEGGERRERREEGGERGGRREGKGGRGERGGRREGWQTSRGREVRGRISQGPSMSETQQGKYHVGTW